MHLSTFYRGWFGTFDVVCVIILPVEQAFFLPASPRVRNTLGKVPMRSSFPRCVLLTTATAAVTFTVLQASFAQSTRIGLNFDGIGANRSLRR